MEVFKVLLYEPSWWNVPVRLIVGTTVQYMAALPRIVTMIQGTVLYSDSLHFWMSWSTPYTAR